MLKSQFIFIRHLGDSSWRWGRRNTEISLPEPSASQQTSCGVQRTQDSRAPGRARRYSWGHSGGSGSGAGWCDDHSTAPRGCRSGPHTWVPAGTARALSQRECLGRHRWCGFKEEQTHDSQGQHPPSRSSLSFSLPVTTFEHWKKTIMQTGAVGERKRG